MIIPATGLACLALLVWGWASRGEFYVTAEFGLGYGLGVAGTTMMVLLLGYSLRKRLRGLQGAGSVRVWFTVHMILGLLGPVAVLFHANFSLGSLNSTIALGCVLLVSGSGVIGRLIYPRIHHGMAGHRASLRELRDAAAVQRGALGAGFEGSASREPLEEVERISLSGDGVLAAFKALMLLRPRSRRLMRSSTKTLSAANRRALGDYLLALRRAAGFRLYERLFAWWHAFHMPLCVMLFVAAAVHVFAVHMY